MSCNLSPISSDPARILEAPMACPSCWHPQEVQAKVQELGQALMEGRAWENPLENPLPFDPYGWFIMGFYGIYMGFIWDFMGFIWDFIGFLWDFMGFLWDLLWDSMGFYGILWDLLWDLYGILWIFMGFIMGFYGIL